VTTAGPKPGTRALATGFSRWAAGVVLTTATTLVAAAPSDLPAASIGDGPSRARHPNVLVILTDDVGFAASSTFGGPVRTPTLDALAAAGLRYTNFHTTALCSPTRAALLTGRNSHAVGMGSITEGASAEPGYTSVIPKSAATVARVLRDQGYRTAAFGKYHLIPKWELSAAGPFAHWPTSMGFDYFYGFEPAMTDQFTPNLIENGRVLAPRYEAGYFLERDLADRAIHWLRETRTASPDRPFFMYYATATAHAPVQAPAEWIAKYRGRFDHGWDAEREAILGRQKQLGILPPETVLTPRAPGVAAWDSLDTDRQRVAARLMEVYAGALSYADEQIGRVISELRASGQYDDTVIVYIQGDNGASPEGGAPGLMNYYDGLNALGLVDPPRESTQQVVERLDELGGPDSEPAIPTGWTNALDTPFPLWKADAASLGGVRNGLVIAWPRGLRDRGGIRRQFHAVTDIAATVYELTGVSPAAVVDGTRQQPLDGVSMAYTFGAPDAPSRRREQYFETNATLSMYRDGWWASYRALPGEVIGPELRTRGTWQLFDLTRDPSQSRDVAAENPRRLAALKREFARVAARNQVFPIQRARTTRSAVPAMEAPGTYVLYPGTERYSDWGFPNVRRRSWSLTARIESPDGGGSGVIVNQGGRFAGWGLVVLNGVPNFLYRRGSTEDAFLRLRASSALGAGPHTIVVTFTEELPKEAQGFRSAPIGASEAPGAVSLSIDGRRVAEGRIERPARSAFMYQGGAVGHSTGSALTDDYTGPFPFTGRIESVEFELTPRR
jgi:arylsulfatase A-like enzyme